MADRAKFLDFLDMIDGGGAGQRGNQFEGGGIFSMLANLMPINPYGSEDKTRREARDEFFAEQGITPQQAAATPAVIRALQYDAGPITQDMRPQVRPQPNFPNYAPPSASSMPQRSFPNNAPPSVSSMPQRSFPNYAPPSAAVGSGRGTMGMPVPLQGSGRGTMGMPMQGSGRGDMGMSTAAVADDTEFMNFMQQARNDPMFSGVINNPQAMRDIFNTYKQQMAARQR